MVEQSDSLPISISADRLVNVSSLSGALHDARIDLATLKLKDNVLMLQGQIERPIPGRMAVGRYPIQVAVPHTTTYSVADEAGIGLLLVEEVEIRGPLIHIIGAIPASLVLESQSDAAHVTVGSHPEEIRRLWKWRSVTG